MNRLQENNPLNKWTQVLEETLPDSRQQVDYHIQLLISFARHIYFCEKIYVCIQIFSNVT